MKERGISTILGVAILLVIVLLLVVAAAVATTGLAENALDTAVVHSQANYDVQVENDPNEKLFVRLRGFQERDASTEFVFEVNNRELFRWDGQSEIAAECFYPGDSITIVSASGDTTYLVDEYLVEQPTDCTRYNTFRDKFENGVVDGNSYTIRDEYDFGLSIVPNGDTVADDPDNSTTSQNLGRIPLSNDWHYVERYDKEVENVSAPVFVVVMVDNVHWDNVPDSSLTGVSSDTYYNWTHSPPTGLNPGADSFDVNGSEVIPNNNDQTEPTNDIYFLFKPGCDSSTLKFVNESAGYDNEIYLDDVRVINNTNNATKDQTFDAPGVECPEGVSW